MEWTRLDLRKASVLRKEVDLAVRLLTRAAAAGGDEAALELQLLIESAQNRIREIEEFYTQNDDDERSILFEKQRLRLRRAVQGVVTGLANQKPKADPTASTRPVTGTENGDYQTPRGKPRPLPLSRESSYEPQRSNRISPKHTLKSAMRTAAHTRSAAKTPLSPGSIASTNSQPIYAWELANQADNNNTIRERITTDSASFIPSNAMGIYVCDSDNGSDSNDLMDFQVVLSAEEFQVYVSRRRNAVAEKKHSERFIDHKKTAAEKASLLSSGPYVDPKRIQSELLRPAQPHKWIGDGAGFRPTGSKIQ